MSLGEREAGARWFPPFMLQGISRSHLAPVLRLKANQFKSISPKFVPVPIVFYSNDSHKRFPQYDFAVRFTSNVQKTKVFLSQNDTIVVEKYIDIVTNIVRYS